MEFNNDQTQNNQAPNQTAKSQQPKKTWVEPELVSMGVEGGIHNSSWESTKDNAGTTTFFWGSN